MIGHQILEVRINRTGTEFSIDDTVAHHDKIVRVAMIPINEDPARNTTVGNLVETRFVACDANRQFTYPDFFNTNYLILGLLDDQLIIPPNAGCQPNQTAEGILFHLDKFIIPQNIAPQDQGDLECIANWLANR